LADESWEKSGAGKGERLDFAEKETAGSLKVERRESN
jgi:hypothetical protein